VPVRRLFAAVSLAVLTGCTTTVTGHPTPVGPPRSPATPPRPCADHGPDPAGMVRCLVADVSAFWAGRLGRPVSERMVVSPEPAAVPRGCRTVLGLGTAFYCTDNRTVYLTAASVARSRRAYGQDLPYELAAVVGHEFGHVVQDLAHQPGFDATDLAVSRRIEQQADCLLGVWAHDAGVRRLLDPDQLREIARREFATIERLHPPALGGYDERATHGTVAERVAALSRGLAAGTRNACGLRLGAKRR
jgi:predicted metalloprotease